jgi:hypothetical protein
VTEHAPARPHERAGAGRANVKGTTVASQDVASFSVTADTATPAAFIPTTAHASVAKQSMAVIEAKLAGADADAKLSPAVRQTNGPASPVPKTRHPPCQQLDPSSWPKVVGTVSAAHVDPLVVT